MHAEAAQQGHRGHPALPDRDRSAQQIGEVGFDQLPVDGVVAEQRVDVLVAGLRAGTVEDQIVPVADPGQQVEAQQCGQPEHRQRLALRIGVNQIWLDIRLVLQQSLNDVDRFPHAARNEMTEQRNVGIGDVPHRQPAITAVADVGLREKVICPGFDLGTVSASDVAGAHTPATSSFTNSLITSTLAASILAQVACLFAVHDSSCAETCPRICRATCAGPSSVPLAKVVSTARPSLSRTLTSEPEAGPK